MLVEKPLTNIELLEKLNALRLYRSQLQEQLLAYTGEIARVEREIAHWHKK